MKLQEKKIKNGGKVYEKIEKMLFNVMCVVCLIFITKLEVHAQDIEDIKLLCELINESSREKLEKIIDGAENISI